MSVGEEPLEPSEPKTLRYRISRHVVTDEVEVMATSPEEAKAIFDKTGVEQKTEFSHTSIEEVPEESEFTGYRETTTADLIEEAKARP